MDVDRALKYVTLINAVLLTVLTTLWVISTFRQLYPAQVLGIELFPMLGIERIARAIVAMLYVVFKWVVISVTILLGIGSALGLARDVLGLIGITVPRATLNTFIKSIIQLLLIKAIVDAVLRYLGYMPAQLAVAEQVLLDTWLGVFLLGFAVSATGYLVFRRLYPSIEIIVE